MNYRHVYHAGNICDVVKHSVLTLLVEALKSKETAFAVLDTHAGAGLYDLTSAEALKTDEASSGIFRLWKKGPCGDWDAYLRVIRSMNEGETLCVYPGSPLIVQRLIRARDRLIVCERHPETARSLKRLFRGVPQAQTHERNGYEALTALIPPVEKRGLVLIDPPFEDPDEFERLAGALMALAGRWPQAQVMVWYPIKERPCIWRFHEALTQTAWSRLLCAEFVYAEEFRHDRLNGSGLILVNPPWRFEKKLESLFPALHQALETDHKAWTVRWIRERPETA